MYAKESRDQGNAFSVCEHASCSWPRDINLPLHGSCVIKAHDLYLHHP